MDGVGSRRRMKENRKEGREGWEEGRGEGEEGRAGYKGCRGPSVNSALAVAAVANIKPSLVLATVSTHQQRARH